MADIDAPLAAPADPFRQDPDALYTKEEAAHFLNMSPRTLAKWLKAGTGPAPVTVGGRFIRWRRRTLVAWIESHEQTTASPKAPQIEERVAGLEAAVAELIKRIS